MRRAAMSPEASARANRDDALADASGDMGVMNNPGSRRAAHFGVCTSINLRINKTVVSNLPDAPLVRNLPDARRVAGTPRFVARSDDPGR